MFSRGKTTEHPKKEFSSDVVRELPVLSLVRRNAPLADTRLQREVLEDIDLVDADGRRATFQGTLAAQGCPTLEPAALEIFQMNLGKLCNMSCRHCHVDAGPDHGGELMSRQTMVDCLAALDQLEIQAVDLTGGAPEMNPDFMWLVDQLVERGLHVMDRCNLTILLAPGFTHLPAWLADRGVEIVCSLPHYRRRNTDAQRGRGTFDQSLAALKILNGLGYGQGNPRHKLTLVANPAGAFLAGDQCAMAREWKRELDRNFGISFDSLITLNNMPIARYLEWLQETDNLALYMETLLDAFNPQTIQGLMCRNTISVSWEGLIFDCDFNQMLDIPVAMTGGAHPHIASFDPRVFAERRIRTGRHCYGCTAGAGSSCGGALAE